MNDLNLIRLRLALPDLHRWAGERNESWAVRRASRKGHMSLSFDEGRALHHLLAETFGPGMLKPFRLMAVPASAQANLYAYSTQDAASLYEHASTCALPEALKVCPLDRLEAKPMPRQWRVGKKLGFNIRLRPVRRLKKPLSFEEGTQFSAGSEVDAFLVEAARRFPHRRGADSGMTQENRTRESVYSDWLDERLSQQGGARLAAPARLASFRRDRVARKGGAPEGPDAVLQGDLEIADPEKFASLLAHGIGRHRAYGYGMVLLSPPSARAGDPPTC